MMLEHCTKDFNSLIERFDILRAYEDAEEGHRYEINNESVFGVSTSTAAMF